ncbi:MAG: DUF1127 domain-containing protein [Alphaproteobacteria bacterium]|nr:DUF1127 domain-containing protein [Alphaproteobacteria bacterium]
MHTKILTPSHSGTVSAGLRTAVGPAVWLARRVAEHLRRKRDYKRLSSLDDHLLKDIGIDRADIPNIVDGHGPKGPAREKWIAVEHRRPPYII